MSYLGNSPGVSSQRTTSSYTATSGQTTFTATGGYQLGYVDVYLNGTKLVASTDYTASNGTTIVLVSGANVGDSVDVVSYQPRGLSDGYLKSEADAKYELLASKGVANGYAGLDGSAKIPSSQLPSYVDDVLEAANLAALPATGTSGIIYVTLDTNKTYRWSGSAYVEVSAGPSTTDALTEGSTNLYYTDTRARASISATSASGVSYNSGTGVFSLSSVPNSSLTNSSITINGSSVSLGGSTTIATASAATPTALGTVYGLTGGTQATSLGYQAGANSPTYTTSVGYQAGYSSTATVNNYGSAYFGVKAGYTATTGTDNTFIGNFSGYLTNTGSNNVAVGGGALNSNTTASYNTAVGYQAFYTNTTANYNTAIGYQAGYTSNATAAPSNVGANVFIGSGAGYSATSAIHSTFVGGGAGYNVNSGSSNTLVGRIAGYNLTTGTFNTFVGPGDNNGGSGYLISTGGKNTIIGAYSGNQGGLDIRTASNYIVLSDGDGNPRAYWNGANAKFGGTLTVETSLTSNDATAWYYAGSNGGILQLGNDIGNPSRIRAFTPSGRSSATVLNVAVDAVATSGSQVQVLEVGVGLSVSLQGATPKTGTGITFPATQSASSDANTLDDYEEGTWTPSLGGNTTYTVQSGTYVKIGKVVTINFSLTINSIGTGSINTISGLPFSSANQATGLAGYFSGLYQAYGSLGFFTEGTTLRNIGIQTGVTVQGVDRAIFANGTRIDGCSITYYV